MPVSSTDPSGRPDAGHPSDPAEASTAPTAAAQPPPSRLQQALGSLLPEIEQSLARACEFGPGCPPRLGEAIRYALLAPGKRLRPALVLMAAEACGGTAEAALPGAVAVEMIHAYSLIHDDLPAMDDDDLRRGRPTVHIQFDQATAILAGDALQPLAVTHLCRNVDSPPKAARAVEILMAAAGPENLVGGQADDLAAEAAGHPAAKCSGGDAGSEPSGGEPSGGEPSGGDPRLAPEPVHATRFNGAISNAAVTTASESVEGLSGEDRQRLRLLESIHRRKTGALFAASLQLGGVLADASEQQSAALKAYADDLGLAFQVVDDLLDYTADEAVMGKRVGKDADRGKLTYPGLMGVEQARRLASDLITAAKSRLAVFGPDAWRLNTLADYVLERSH